MTRTFIAVEIGDDARAYLEREIARLRRALPDVRWIDPQSAHLTLAFLSELDDERLRAAHDAAEGAARGGRPFTLEVGGLGTFGPPHAPRVIWVGLTGDLRRLSALQDGLARSLAARGFASQEHPFSPHLTLARLKAPLGAAELARLTQDVQASSVKRSSGATIPVDHICVMKSELARTGARYTCLRVVRLGAEGGLAGA
jgi:RNA 2',3'-cyclic 3'-phosphodiesterase